MSTLESLTAQIVQMASTADNSLRYRLSGQLQRLARAIATPRQIMQHYGYTYTEQVMAKIAVDLDIFSILSKSEGPMKTEDVASKTGGDPALISTMSQTLWPEQLVLMPARSYIETPCLKRHHQRD